MTNKGGNKLSPEASENFRWCVKNKIAKITREVCYDRKTMKYIGEEIRYYLADGTEIMYKKDET